MTEKKKESAIDLMEYVYKFWDARYLFIKVGGIAAIVGLIIAFTTPKEYTASVKLAPELGSRKNSGFSSLASMLGVGGGLGSDQDALSVALYPDVVASTPFIIDLMDTYVTTMDEEEPDTTLVEYLKTNKKALLPTVLSLPKQAIGGIISLIKGKEEVIEKEIDPFQLTKSEASNIRKIRQLIMTEVDRKTGVTTISVTMQDPMVAAMVTDTVLSKLKEHIFNYRISKAQEDCNYYEKLYNESKENYYKAQNAYALFLDANKNIILRSVQIEGERLQNEVTLAYGVYTQMANQLQMSRAKVQEAKPLFTVIEPASVPQLPTGLSRKFILVAFVFMGCFGLALWIIIGKEAFQMIKESVAKKKNKKIYQS